MDLESFLYSRKVNGENLSIRNLNSDQYCEHVIEFFDDVYDNDTPVVSHRISLRIRELLLSQMYPRATDPNIAIRFC